MATKTKAAVRTSTGKGGRRPPVKVKRGSDVPLLPIAVGGILLAFAIGVIIYSVVNNKPTPGPATAAGIPCDSLQHSQVHYHSAIQIVYEGTVHPIPANIGISGDPASPTCYYWLHVHAADPNTIHIESPANQTFTLGQFFAVWTAWNKAQGLPAEPLDATHVSSFTLTPEQKLVVYIDLQDGKGAQPYTGNPNAIVLKSHEVITLEITPPTVTPPSFTFNSGL
ncbi:MAG TPA: hypothetical protein VK606_06745 [Verrucomicrobiae bacterium]|jgi:hypothetical protein|nr:hypothetical protein [Verrucomicrobiae bacterium]